ncbi:MAG: Asp-tRNA(Asn)/Glu-tRNA(Gln) amidotransferase subunit GatB [Armatimonadetes bacterium]|nr:Asp-tRNA(Asn)/Glu-tRNA(Gln) amidotransferase subunit GatB [Armatimonadota bacterium]
MYEPIVGVEVHAQLTTSSKMFCSCRAEFGAEPNTNVCPVCLGLPGSLPVTNRKAVEQVIRTGLALGCEVGTLCRFYRKNYFYPDLAKNYQISQYDEPLTFGGRMELSVEGRPVSIRIRRAHLEEDTGKNIHLPNGRSLVEYNRCGVPLMEIVTEPDFRSAAEVREYLLQLRRLLWYLGVSTANMEEGALRAEPTVNLRDPETGERTPKVEIKNLASIRAVHDAVEYEIRRQYHCLETGEPMQQETRRWNEAQGITTVMRTKESAEDYMYFPEPDLVPIEPEPEWVEAIRAALPELPQARQQRFVAEYGLPEYDAQVLTEDRATADYFEAVVQACGEPKACSNWVMGDLQRLLNESGCSITESRVSPQQLAELIGTIKDGTISHNIAQAVLPKMWATGHSAREVIAAENLALISDATEIEKLVDEAIAANPKAVADYRGGKEKALGAIVGHVMRQTKGQANAAVVNELILARLNG